MSKIKIKSALISVFNKDGLDKIVEKLIEQDIVMYSTGGTQAFIESLGGKVERVEDLTGYPSILDGRVKTLHPKVFGGILAVRNDDHLSQLAKFDIPTIDLVIVDLYPFEETVASATNEEEIIEKIDIGGIALIRGAAKNFNDVVIIPSKDEYSILSSILNKQGGLTDFETRKDLARRAFKVSSHYDTAIFRYFNKENENDLSFKHSILDSKTLRYGENPHQQGTFFGKLEENFEVFGSKELSYNNLVDVDAAILLMKEFKDDLPAFAILKHTNACGVAVRPTVLEAWKAALAGDPISAFGGILICNTTIDLATAKEIDKLFYEVLIAPAFDQDAHKLLTAKPKRILMKINGFDIQNKTFKTLLNGVIMQDSDLAIESEDQFTISTNEKPTAEQVKDLIFANKLAKHLKSNTIVLAKDNQLLGMGCGQTSRIDACRHAIEKATSFGFDIKGAAMASDAFFPFPDCVELAYNAGITSVIQPGGSIKDQLSIDFCNDKKIPMVMTGVRHFKH